MRGKREKPQEIDLLRILKYLDTPNIWTKRLVIPQKKNDFYQDLYDFFQEKNLMNKLIRIIIGERKKKEK